MNDQNVPARPVRDVVGDAPFEEALEKSQLRNADDD